MGYNTAFAGEIKVEPPLNEHEISYLRDFAEIRHTYIAGDPESQANAKPFAIPGNDTGNDPHPGMPGIWMNWWPEDDGGKLVWTEEEKTYHHDKWLTWIINNLLSDRARSVIDQHKDQDPRLEHFTCDHTFSGMVHARGEDFDDIGAMCIAENGLDVETARLLEDPYDWS